MDLSRTEIIINRDGIDKLKNSKVAIFGLGGVGGYSLEALVRGGIGTIYIFDFDRFHSSNLNRQILALEDNIGEMKTHIAVKRAKEINPEIKIIPCQEHLTKNNIASIIPDDIEYAIDAIDEIDAKVALITELHKKNICLISSMGAGNRIDPSKIKIDDISKTSYCPLARKVRKRLKSNSIYKGVSVVYSTEEPLTTDRSKISEGERAIGSISYLPGIFGLTAAGYIIKAIVS